MQKEPYYTPETHVLLIRTEQFICASTFSSPSNVESFDEEDITW